MLPSQPNQRNQRKWEATTAYTPEGGIRETRGGLQFKPTGRREKPSGISYLW